MHGVAVTGIGVVAPNGASVEPFWASLLSGNSALDEALALPGSGITVSEVRDDGFLEGLPVKAAALDRSAQFAVVAAGQALAMAGITRENVDASRVAVIIGNGAGGQVSMDAQFVRLYGQGHSRLNPLTVAKSMVSSSASWVSIAYGLLGPTFVIASACASGTHAIGVAAGLIRAGVVDVAVTGGTEAPLAPGTVRAWESMRILSPDACRPFSNNRKGLILGEGCGMLVLESEAHASARGARSLASVAGFASCADAGDMFNPSRDGMARSMRGALTDAGLTYSDVDYVNAHGTGTLANDATETEALKMVFGKERCPPISAIKSVTGHGLGASGGIEAVATVLALSRQMLPPTANYDSADPACDLDYVPNRARAASPKLAISNSFAFGGLNASLLLAAA